MFGVTTAQNSVYILNQKVLRFYSQTVELLLKPSQFPYLNNLFETQRLKFGTKFLEKNAYQVQANRVGSLEEANSNIVSMARQGGNYQDLEDVLKEADIIVAAIGRAHFVKKEI